MIKVMVSLFLNGHEESSRFEDIQSTKPSSRSDPAMLSLSTFTALCTYSREEEYLHRGIQSKSKLFSTQNPQYQDCCYSIWKSTASSPICWVSDFYKHSHCNYGGKGCRAETTVQKKQLYCTVRGWTVSSPKPAKWSIQDLSKLSTKSRRFYVFFVCYSAEWDRRLTSVGVGPVVKVNSQNRPRCWASTQVRG